MSDSSQTVTKRPLAAVSSSSHDTTITTNGTSQALLMPPPPPPKCIKRPSTVLDEDIYTSALSHIIARDFFPGLLETQIKQEYLDALESKDKEWIASARRNLREVVAAGRAGNDRARRSRMMMNTPERLSGIRDTPVLGMDTPRGWGGETPMTVRTAATTTATPSSTIVDGSDEGKDPSKGKVPDVSHLGLSAFQAKYTSEDNESFYKVLDKQNAKRREKHAWLWSGNKIPSARQIAYHKREAKRITEHGGRGADTGEEHGQEQALIKTDLDARPAKPDTWKSRPENSLMFIPSSVEDTLETVQQRAEAESRAGPKRVLYQNTRLAENITDTATATSGSGSGVVPPSPSLSAIQDAIAGRPRPTESEALYNIAGGETPRVNGYAFVDEDEPEPEDNTTLTDDEADDLRLLGASDANSTPNPFSIQETRRREALHHRMVDRVARNKRAEKSNVVSCRTDTPTSSTTAASRSVPRFPSSPRLDYGLRRMDGGGGGGGGMTTPGRRALLTPAAQRLLSTVGNGAAVTTPRHSSSSGLKNMWTPTPRRAK